MLTSKEKSDTKRLPMMPIRDVVIFPYMMTPFVVGRESSVRALEEVLEAQGLLDAGRKLPGSLDRDLRVVAEHVHSEEVRGICDFHADCAEPHDPKRAARQLVPNEAFLALLHRGLQGIS